MKKLLLLLLLHFINVNAQNTTKTEDYQYVSTITIDEKNKEIIPFVNISNVKRQIYRISNENGEIEFPYLTSHLNDTIVFSGIGIETKKIVLKNIAPKVLLENSFDILNEIIITTKRSPESILKEVISKLEENHPTHPHNYKRYSKILSNKNDINIFELELVAKEFSFGYRQEYITTLGLERVNWITKDTTNTLKYTSQLFAYRENPIQYANILHKRKHKKFTLNFATTNKKEEEQYYIISFKTEKDDWNFTNKSYPTAYFGSIYIRKNDFSIAKIIEKWEGILKNDDLDYYLNKTKHRNIIDIKLKEQSIAVFNKKIENKYYVSNFDYKNYSEVTFNSKKTINSSFNSKSYLFDFELNDVKEISYENYENEKINTVLNDTEINTNFWKNFTLSEM
ncbi:hypothetical protein [uncultured Tenacibaculum sp.]|uniref:hypothetical protein n=1 Tax=uncultured Tenacibaculum sp. TaxID=174713 RepID=UPI00261113A5|nr:hypothetical protein [uncultured Tenacibaculum sp.]